MGEGDTDRVYLFRYARQGLLTRSGAIDFLLGSFPTGAWQHLFGVAISEHDLGNRSESQRALDALKITVSLRKLRGDPRYAALLKRMNLPPDWCAVAARLSLSSASVYKLCQRGELRGLRIGGALRFSPQVIDDYVTRCKARRRSSRRSP